MMTIILNGENKQIDNNTNIAQLLQSLDLASKRLAVEINQQIIPRSHFASHSLNELDKVEIVQAIGGGGGNSIYSVFFIHQNRPGTTSPAVKSSTIASA